LKKGSKSKTAPHINKAIIKKVTKSFKKIPPKHPEYESFDYGRMHAINPKLYNE